MDKLFSKIMSVLAFGVIVWLAWEEKDVALAVWFIFAGIIFGANIDQFIKMLEVIKGLK